MGLDGEKANGRRAGDNATEDLWSPYQGGDGASACGDGSRNALGMGARSSCGMRARSVGSQPAAGKWKGRNGASARMIGSMHTS